ncbi:MAG: peroxidase [Gammaproteobacteria bacterium]|nr:peroxidase [Gammaproteobacteria bacterium]
MTFINTVRPDDACNEVREMYERQQDFWGYVPNYAKTFSHRPEVLARWGRLLAELRRPADDRRFELVTFAAAHALKNSACSLAHGKELALIIGEDSVVAIAEGREESVLPADEVAIVRYARQIARDPRRVTCGQIDSLKMHHNLDDADIFDIAAIVAGRCFLTRLLDGLGCEADAAFLSLDKNLRDALSVGRPICQRPLEFLPAKDAA